MTPSNSVILKNQCLIQSSSDGLPPEDGKKYRDLQADIM